ncbi:MAG: hypothetical protein JWP66_1283 [Naasia sp.]|nr:hypothetical protein [Naasia sp.]
MNASNPLGPAPFPPGRQFAVTWAVERQFGGMTAAMLRRSQAIAEATSQRVDILTFDVRDDYAAVAAHLRDGGRLPDALRLRNLWDELADGAPDAPTPPPPRTLSAFDPLPPSPARTATRVGADGTLLQLDRRRTDGTLAVSDRRDAAQRGTPGGRSIVLCDAAGEPLGGFRRARDLYAWWLDAVIGDTESFLLIDSKTTAARLLGYRNPRATRVHIMHSSHLAGDSRPFGLVKDARRSVLTNLEDFDSVVILSERQRADLHRMLGPADNLDVVPNAAAPLGPVPPAERDPGLGVVVAQLEDRKRIDHAVRAVAAARRAGAEVRLDVYGDGAPRAELERLAEDCGAADAIRFLGFHADAAESFTRASFFLLTSTTEGFPLVLVEGMARGCIPLAYDIPYGPADIIDPGTNGVLVPSGDVGALASAIADVAGRADTAALRAAAARAAEAYTDDAVLRRWAQVLAESRRRRDSTGRRFTVAVRAAEVDRSGTRTTATVDFTLAGIDVAPSAVRAAIGLSGASADGPVEVRAEGSVRRTLRRGVWRASVRFDRPATAWIPLELPLSATLDLRANGRTLRVPLGT